MRDNTKGDARNSHEPGRRSACACRQCKKMKPALAADLTPAELAARLDEAALGFEPSLFAPTFDLLLDWMVGLGYLTRAELNAAAPYRIQHGTRPDVA